jgi:hypothetical protein
MTTLSLIRVSAFSLCLSFAPLSLVDPQAEVNGTVTDVSGARISGASLRFAQGEREVWARTSPDGIYSVRLHPGTYEVQARSLGFCPMRRGSFILDPGATATLDFELPTCAFDDAKKPFLEEELPAPEFPKIVPLLQYGRRKSNSMIEYTGFFDQGKYFRPVFTYNLWTVRANTITYDSAARLLTAKGDVVSQDGRTATPASFIQIHLGEPTEIVKIVP